jgi:hypothetical protein
LNENTLYQLFLRISSHPDYKGVEKTISSASVLDKTVIAALNGEMEPLMQFIKNDFTKELDDLMSYTRDSTEVKDHTDTIIQIKVLVSEISNTHIQHLADRSISSYLAEISANKCIDLYRLGVSLANSINVFGKEVTDKYACFKAVRNQQFNQETAVISNAHALDCLLKLNPMISPQEKASLTDALRDYDIKYTEHLRNYLPGYRQYRVKPQEELIRTLKSSATGSSPNMVELLAGIFALWTIMSSRDTYQETKERTCLITPHPVQLIAIFRLLAIDSVRGLISSLLSWMGVSSSPIPGHLIQVGTGEGKSIILGGLSALLGLLGYEIFCASYSKHLSKRDHEEFLPLFEALGIDTCIHYSTLSELAEKVINRNGDVRELAKNHISSDVSNFQFQNNPSLDSKKILLIDEVDVFFSESFFGATYNLGGSFSSPETRYILTEIYNRSGAITIDDIREFPEYKTLVSSFCPEARRLIDQNISLMIQDVPHYASPRYEIVTLSNGSKKIGYKDQDSVSCHTSYGYRTAFAYLHELQQHPTLAEHLDRALCLRLKCGKFSYAEIARNSFCCIMGVTGVSLLLHFY